MTVYEKYLVFIEMFKIPHFLIEIVSNHIFVLLKELCELIIYSWLSRCSKGFGNTIGERELETITNFCRIF